MSVALIGVGIVAIVGSYLASVCKKKNLPTRHSFAIGFLSGVCLVVLFMVYDFTRRYFGGLGFEGVPFDETAIYGVVLSLLMGLRCAFPEIK